MPIYEYECQNCNHQFDLIQKMSEEPVKQCPKCFKNTAVRMISAAGFQLKGAGWYQTDFKDKPKKAANQREENKPSTNSDSQSSQKKGEDN